ncbi:MAG TPA: phosphoglycolate phosphatase [Thermoplasmata archaeon]|nr:phosphoglycolate phosphatase [Thermoplasmata archaeon]
MTGESRPGPGDVRAIVVDIDGTLTDDYRRMSLEAVAALRRVEDSGVSVMLASGNVLPIAYAVSTYMGFKGPIIAENGGVVCHRQRVWVLGDAQRPREAWELLRREIPGAERLFTDRWRETEIGLKQDVDLGLVRELLRPMQVEVQTTGWAVHIMSEGMDKLVGVEKGCEVLGLDIGSVGAIGDSENDIRMIEGCGWGVAIGNADDRTKSSASYVANGRNGDGVVEGLKWLRVLPE